MAPWQQACASRYDLAQCASELASAQQSCEVMRLAHDQMLLEASTMSQDVVERRNEEGPSVAQQGKTQSHASNHPF